MKYYIIPQDKITEFTPLMDQSFGHPNFSIRMNLNNTFGLMQFTDELAPTGYIAYSIEDITHQLESDEWVEDYTYQKGKVLRIHDMSKEFKLPIDSVTNVAFKSDTTYNEFNGLKERTEYVNENLDLVAVKLFSLYQQDGKKGTKLTLKFYDRNNEVDENSTVVTIDYYSDLQIRAHKSVCVLRVFDRLLWDFEQELKGLQQLINSSDEPTKLAIANSMGLPDIATLEGMPSYVQSLFDDLMKIHLKESVDIMYKTGDSTELFNAITTIDYTFLDQQALTSEQAVKYTYRQILMAKFNPQNFKFYE